MYKLFLLVFLIVIGCSSMPAYLHQPKINGGSALIVSQDTLPPKNANLDKKQVKERKPNHLLSQIGFLLTLTCLAVFLVALYSAIFAVFAPNSFFAYLFGFKWIYKLGLSLCLPAFVCSFLGFRKARKNPDKWSKGGIAFTALIMSGIILLWVILALTQLGKGG